MHELICEYKQSLREMKEIRKDVESRLKENQCPLLQQDKSLINSMITEMEYVITWLQNGRNPNEMRGIERTSVYLLDPVIFEAVIPNPKVIEGRELTDDEKFKIEEALSSLTEREKDVFILVKANKFTWEQTAELLGVSKSSVQTYLERAEKKVQGQKQMNLFLVS